MLLNLIEIVIAWPVSVLSISAIDRTTVDLALILCQQCKLGVSELGE